MRLAVEQHRSGDRGQQPGQAAQQGGLAAAVGADDHRDPAGRDLDGEVVDDQPLAVAEAESRQVGLQGRVITISLSFPTRLETTSR